MNKKYMIITLEHDISPVVERILKEQWKAKENEKILIITDNPSKEDFSSMSYELMSTMLERNLLAKIFQTIAKKLGYKETELYFIKPTYAHYKDPEDQALEKMVSTADIIFSLTEFSLTDVPTIKKYLDEKKLRHCSAPLILSDIFIEEGPLDINIEEMKQTTLQLHNILKNSKKIVLSDIAHSNLTIVNNSVMWMCEDGI